MKGQKHINRRQFAVKTVTGASALLLPSGLHATGNGSKLKLLSYNVWYGFNEKAERNDDWLKFMI